MLVNKGTRFAGLAKTLRDHCSLVEVNAGQKDHKLVSALASEYRGAAGSDRLFEHLDEIRDEDGYSVPGGPADEMSALFATIMASRPD